MGKLKGKAAVATLACVMLAGLAVPPGAGAITRAQYIDRVDPICHRINARYGYFLRAYSRNYNRGNYEAAGRAFIRGSRMVLRGIERAARVPRPAGDSDRLGRWYRLERRSKRLYVRSGKALQRNDLSRYRRLGRRGDILNRAGNRTVRNYGFRHCGD